MGTRGLTMVISEGKTRIAQYGQWDHYPSGQGVTVLNFLRDADFDSFKKKLKKVKFIKRKKQAEIDLFLKSIGCENGWLNSEQSEKYNKQYPFLTRDHGAGILEQIDSCTEKEIWLHDSSTFAADGLFCEWAYVIDFDKNTFEIYKGFNQGDIHESERFYKYIKKSENGYTPVVHVKTYDLNKLPTEKKFLKEFENL